MTSQTGSAGKSKEGGAKVGKMTDVLLSKARDLMRQATDEPWNASIQKTLTEKLQQLASRSGTDSVSDAGSVLHHFKKPENREA